MSLTGLAFLACFSAGLFLSLARHPVFGLYVYLAVFYLDPSSRWWGAELPDVRWSLIAAIVTLLSVARLPRQTGDRPAWYRTAPAMILMCYSIWMWIQNLWAVNPEAHITASVLFTKYVILFYVIYRLIQTPEQMRIFIAVHVAGCLYLGILGYLSDDGGRLEGVGGPGIGEANALAMHLGTSIMLGSMIVLSERRWAFWLSLGAMPFIVNTFVLAGSRGAFLALIIASLTLWFMAPRSHRGAFVAMGGLALVLFMMLASDNFWERMGTIQQAAARSEEIDASAASRYVMFEVQLSIAKEYPHGTGHRGTEKLGQSYIDDEGRLVVPGGRSREGLSSSHNTFMTALAEQGLVGAVLYLAMLVYCVRTSRRLRLRWQEASGPMGSYVAGMAAALVVVFIAGQFVDYIKAEVQIWLFALLASAAQLQVASGAAVNPEAISRGRGVARRALAPKRHAR